MPPSDKLSSSSAPDREGAWRTTEYRHGASTLLLTRQLSHDPSRYIVDRFVNSHFAFGSFRTPRSACPEGGNNAARAARSCTFGIKITIEAATHAQAELDALTRARVGMARECHRYRCCLEIQDAHETRSQISGLAHVHACLYMCVCARVCVLDPGKDLHPGTSWYRGLGTNLRSSGFVVDNTRPVWVERTSNQAFGR